MKVVVVGGGWAGVSAAIAAKNAGASVCILERTDMLLGTGLVGGIMRNNGRYTATEEAIALGFGELFRVIDHTCRHKNIEFPGHKHASLYDIATIEQEVKKLLITKQIDIQYKSRVKNVQMNQACITAVVLESGEVVKGDAFIDATGSAGPMNNCKKYGNGCAMCVLRCPTFGGRISVAACAGVKEKIGKKADGTYGAMSGSCKLLKESLDPNLVQELNQKGVVMVPIPSALRKGESILASKACQQYALKEFEENIILLDTGHAKLMSPYYPLQQLRQIEGFENARYVDPYSGDIGNSMRFLAIAPRDNSLKIDGVDNLFAAGEKAGLLVGHTEAIVTGMLSGHNAVRYISGMTPLELPREALVIGDAIAYVNEEMQTEIGMGKKYTFSGAIYFERMKARGTYTTDIAKIREQVERVGLTNIFREALR